MMLFDGESSENLYITIQTYSMVAEKHSKHHILKDNITTYVFAKNR